MGCLHTERHCGADPCSLMIPMLIILVWINLCFSIFIMSKCGKSKLYCNRYIVFIFILKWMLSSLQPPFLTWLELFLHSSIPIMVISMFCQRFWWHVPRLYHEHYFEAMFSCSKFESFKYIVIHRWVCGWVFVKHVLEPLNKHPNRVKQFLPNREHRCWFFVQKG